MEMKVIKLPQLHVRDANNDVDCFRAIITLRKGEHWPWQNAYQLQHRNNSYQRLLNEHL